jgi:CheY-like chemotaxis protein
VLYVEDNESNIRLVQRILGHRPGIALESVRHGGEAVAAARRLDPDVVLLDLNLPDMSGVDVLAALRAEPSTRHIPVVVVSADATAAQVARLRALGAADYLTKPFDIHRLLGIVDGVSDGVAPASASPAASAAASPASGADGAGVLDGPTVAQLRSLADVGPDGLHDLVEAFAADASRRHGDLRAAAAAHDAASVGSIAHALKGSCGMFGAVRAAALCDDLQGRGRGGRLGADVEARVDELGCAIDAAIAALRDVARAGASPG